jgi:predicted negative regulator of RcsB-dependent stress response
MGRARIEAKQPDLAIKYYQDVVDNGHPSAIRVIARERLARLLLDQNQPDEALKLIQGEPEIDGFEARYAETRGDIFTALGQNDQAIAAYQEALAVMEEGKGDRAALLLKLESLGVVQPDEESTS